MTLGDSRSAGRAFVVTGCTADDTAAVDEGTRRQIAFYGSTPAYRAVLDLHGWGELQAELNHLSKAGEWARMGELIDDDMLAAFAVVADPEDVAPRLAQRFGDVVTRISLSIHYRRDPHRWAAVIAAIKAI